MKSLVTILLLIFVFIFDNTYAQNFRWARSLAGRGVSSPISLSPGTSNCLGIAVDANEDVYITGFCNDSVDFDPGPSTHFLIGGNDDIFLAKYSSGGDLMWAHVFVSNGWNYATDIALDHSGNVIVIGNCFSGADFDPGPGVAMLNTIAPFSNYGLIAKYDPAGNLIWAKSINGQGTGLRCIELDPSDNIYIAGDFYDYLDPDPSAATATIFSNQSGMFYATYDSNGNYIRADALSGCGNLGGVYDIELSQNGDILLAGIFGNTVDFDPGSGNHDVTATTTCDRFVARYDSQGIFKWVNVINTNNNGGLTVGRSISIETDDQENVYLTGDFSGTVDFDPGPGLVYLTHNNHYATYLCKYDPAGNLVYAKGISGGYCVANNIAIDCFYDLTLAGTFTNADFDPSPLNTFNMQSTAPSAFMNFIAQYDSAGNFNWAKAVGNCGYGGGVIPPALTLAGRSQFLGGGFKQSGDFDPGPDTFQLQMSGVGSNAFFGRYDPVEYTLGIDTSVCEGDTILLDARTPSAIYLWSDHSTLSYLNVNQPGLYWVQVNFRNCNWTDSVNVTDNFCDTSKLVMPNVFTPNDDGLNDKFIPKEIENESDFSFHIYNRWGNKIFESKDSFIGWDGRHNGRDCPAGVYFYVIECLFRDQTNKQLNGTVTLIR